MANYKTVCPECGGNNFGVAEEKGFAYCFNCEHYQKLDNTYARVSIKRSNKISEIREYYSVMAEYWHTCLSKEHRLFLYSRGISDHSINTLKLGYCAADYHILYGAAIAAEAGIFYKGHVQLADRITFPFFAEGQVTDFYGRSLDPNSEIRYLGLFGGSWKRGADYAYMHDCAYKSNARDKLIRTEGLIKAIIANQYGFPCIAYPGTLAYRSGTPPMQGQSQVIVFDNQVNHRRELIKAIKKEAERYSNPKIGVLPLKGKSKADIDQFLLEFGIDEFRRVIDGALDFEVWQKLVK